MKLQNLKNTSILLFGKSRAFSKEEFQAQLKVQNISCVHELNDEVQLIIDGRMMTPDEEIQSEKLYKLKKYNFVSIDSFETSLSKHLNEDTLLMSLKLSGDAQRLKNFIQNTTISDSLFFKLLKMYAWENEDFFENDDNRDVSAAFIARFYKNIEQNHNVQYATTGFVHLIKQTQDSALLDVIHTLEPLQHNPKMKMQLAMNTFASLPLLKKLHAEDDLEVNTALSLNENLPLEIIQKFMDDEKLIQNIAKNILLNEEYFELLQGHQSALSLNESLTRTMQERLLESKDEEVHYGLSLNNNLSLLILEKLLKNENENIKMALYENTSMPKEKLQSAYDEALYLAQLAKNENTPIEILYQLQLDARYERAVKTNASFGKSIKQENIGWL